MDPRRTLVAGVLAALVAAGCGAEPPRTTSNARCESRAAGSRWAGSYRKRATFGDAGSADDSNAWVHEVGGIAVAGPRVYVYDPPEAKVTILDRSLTRVGAFGRKGNGPGELRPMLNMGLRGRNWRWVALAGDTLLLFDGARIQRFDRDGRFVRQDFGGLIGTTALSGRLERIAYHDGFLVTTEGEFDVPAGPGAPSGWRVMAHRGKDRREVLSLRLTPPPVDAHGVVTIGPAQARPMWDEERGCVAATDGSSPWLVRGTVDGGAVDTLPLAYPAVKEPVVDPRALERLAPGGASARPTARRRVAGLIIDPDGYVWLLPWQDSTHVPGGVEVLRIALATGRAERDTVPAFPAAFGAPGVYYAAANDRRNQTAAVVAYTLSGKPARESQ